MFRQTSHVEKITVVVDSINRFREAYDRSREASEAAAAPPGRDDDVGAKTTGRQSNKNMKKAGAGASKVGTQGGGGGAAIEAVPLLRWVKAEDMAEAGLPTLTAKIFKQAY